MLATGVSVTAAATIALAPLPTSAPPPSTHTAPVVLTGAWQDLQANVTEDLANLSTLLAASSSTPILNQLASNVATYGKWLVGQDGGSPEKVTQTIGEHLVAVATTLARYALLVPLSFVGPFVAPGVMLIQLVADTAKSPSTPQTVLQAFIDAPAVYLNTTFNCCSSPLFQLAFGLLNPGPLGYLLEVRSAIAAALRITAPAPPEPAASAMQVPEDTVSPAVAQSSRAPAVGQSLRSPQSDSNARKTSRAAKRPNVAHSAADSPKTPSPTGKGQSARTVKPGNQGTR
ncbi:hypothetical protein [Mycolicibacterium sphagni]|uniref:Uncharacterized protein n=1 Tax=Mycolicibacterium sphagni TaxID=1786 RepID=A0ABX2JQ80_9MYCO|nr:hypothetical protein [Mycolicibacterium sphagni]NTY59711.1 hypothetical protein [Mycolicibacterium sphagni]